MTVKKTTRKTTATKSKATSVKKTKAKTAVVTEDVKKEKDVVPVKEIKTEAVKEVKKAKKENTITVSKPLFYLITFFMWFLFFVWIFLEINYEITIEHKNVVARRAMNVHHVAMLKRVEKAKNVRKTPNRIRRTEDLKKRTIKDKKVVAQPMTLNKEGAPVVKDIKAPKKLSSCAARKAQKNKEASRVQSVSEGKVVTVVKDAKVPVNAVTDTAKKAVKTSSCPAFKLVKRKTQFIESEYAPYAGTGKAIIEGNVCFELTDGTQKCFENVDVFINPVTTYSDEWYNRGWAGTEALEKADARAVAFNKVVKTGKDGAFKFEGLQPGSYYVGTNVCLPATKDSKGCSCSRFASKVKMKNRVKTTLKKVFPVK